MADRTNAPFWSKVHARLLADLDLGFRHLLTADWLRTSAIRTLVADGVTPGDLSIGELQTSGRRSRLELSGAGATTSVSFTFARERTPHGGAAAPEVVGTVVYELLRLGELRRTRRVAVQLLQGWLTHPVRRREDVSLLASEGGQFVLTPDQLALVPHSAARSFTGEEAQGGVHADCILSRPLGTLTLQVLVVAPATMGVRGPRPETWLVRIRVSLTGPASLRAAQRAWCTTPRSALRGLADR